MTDVILLAAGKARRFGKQKLLEPFRGKPLYRYAFDAAAALQNVQVTVVTRRGLLDTAAAEYGFACVLVPENQGVGISVAAGTKAAREGAGLCFCVCDQPGISGALLRDFLEGFAASGKPLGRCAAGTQYGSPTAFAPVFRTALLALTADEGGKALFDGREADTYYHEVPEEALRDFDTPWTEEEEMRKRGI